MPALPPPLGPTCSPSAVGGLAYGEDAEYGDVRPIINLRRRRRDRPTYGCFDRETVCRILPEEPACSLRKTVLEEVRETLSGFS